MVLSMLFHCSSRTYSPKCQCSNVYPGFQNGAEISLDQLVPVLMPSLRSTPSCTIIAFTGSLRLVNAVWPENWLDFSACWGYKGYSQGNHCLQGIQRYMEKNISERGHCSWKQWVLEVSIYIVLFSLCTNAYPSIGWPGKFPQWTSFIIMFVKWISNLLSM